MSSFLKLVRSELLLDLAKDPVAISFLVVAGLRAKWSDGPSALGLEKGEALMGDPKSYGATRAQHRRVLCLLERLQILTIKTTNKGTVIKFSDSSIFDFVNGIEQPSKSPPNSQRTTTQQPATNQPTATNVEGKEGKNGKKEESFEGSKLASTDEDWLLDLASQEAYRDLDIPVQYSKMVTWCSANSKLPTRRRFVNWINRCDRPMKAAASSNGHSRPKFPPPPSQKDFLTPSE